jgi:hypothetical protein
MVDECLSAWRRARQMALSVDVAAALSPVGVPIEIELMTRGQAQLVWRLGHRSCSAWYEEFKDGGTGADFDEGRLDANGKRGKPEMRVLWPQWDAVDDSACMWRMGGGKDDAASVSWCHVLGCGRAIRCFGLHGREKPLCSTGFR